MHDLLGIIPLDSRDRIVHPAIAILALMAAVTTRRSHTDLQTQPPQRIESLRWHDPLSASRRVPRQQQSAGTGRLERRHRHRQLAARRDDPSGGMRSPRRRDPAPVCRRALLGHRLLHDAALHADGRGAVPGVRRGGARRQVVSVAGEKALTPDFGAGGAYLSPPAPKFPVKGGVLQLLPVSDRCPP